MRNYWRDLCGISIRHSRTRRRLTSGEINGGKNFGPQAPANTFNYSRPSSDHSGGVNAATCDGAVFWLRDDIEYKVYQQLMTSDGARSNMPPPNNDYILGDGDYR